MTQEYADLERRLREHAKQFRKGDFTPFPAPHLYDEAAAALAALVKERSEANDHARKWELFAEQRVLDVKRADTAREMADAELSALKRDVGALIHPFASTPKESRNPSFAQVFGMCDTIADLLSRKAGEGETKS